MLTKAHQWLYNRWIGAPARERLHRGQWVTGGPAHWLDERYIAEARVLVSAASMLWCLAWFRSDIRSTAASAASALPWAAVVMAVASIWLGWVRKGAARSVRARICGAVLNGICAITLCTVGHRLFVPVVALLPVTSIIVWRQFGARWGVANMGWTLVAAVCSYYPFTGTRATDLPEIFGMFTAMVVIPTISGRMISERVAAATAALDARDQQNQFISMLSHEFRTLTNPIVGGAQLIDVTKLVGDQRRRVESVIASTNVLHRRVSEVLDVAAINSHRISLKTDFFALSDLLPTVQDACADLARERKVDLQLASQPMSGGLLGDLGRIEQVLINLSINAVKFTPAGGVVRVLIRHLPSRLRGHACIQAVVSDTGFGIAAADRDRIFDPFKQLAFPSGRKNDGLGLGLYIVKGITELMGGSVSVDDNPGGGTVFKWSVDLPLGNTEQPTALPSLSQIFEDHMRRIPPLRALIVDDNASSVEVVGATLARAGHTWESVGDGEAGFKAVQKGGFDLVFLDLHMPKLSGWEVLDRLDEQIRQRERPPIVVFSADTDQKSIDSAMGLGALAYLTKPVTPHKLLEALELGCSVHMKGRGAPAVPRQTSPLPTREIRLDIDEIEAVLAPGAIPSFLKQCIASIDSSLAALSNAIQNQDVESIKSITHSLKNEFQILSHEDGVQACNAIRQDALHGRDCTSLLLNVRREAERVQAAITSRPEFVR